MVNVLKFQTPTQKEHPVKQREVTNFATGGNLISSPCKIVTSLTECLVFSFSI